MQEDAISRGERVQVIHCRILFLFNYIERSFVRFYRVKVPHCSKLIITYLGNIFDYLEIGIVYGLNVLSENVDWLLLSNKDIYCMCTISHISETIL